MDKKEKQIWIYWLCNIFPLTICNIYIWFRDSDLEFIIVIYVLWLISSICLWYSELWKTTKLIKDD